MLINRALAHEDILASFDNASYKVESPLWKQRTGRLAGVLNTVEWLWLTRVKPVLCRGLSLVFSLMSLLVVLGEVTLFIDVPIGLFPMMFYEPHGPILTQCLVVIPLGYILLCTHSSLFYLKLQGFYGLYPHNMTDASNLAWSASFLAKITAPLCYNFLKFIKVSGTQFNTVMKVVNLVPVLGEQFVQFFPSLLIVLVALNYFNAFGKLMKSMGLSQFSFNDKFNDTKILEGKSLIAKARMDKIRDQGRGAQADSKPPKWEMASIPLLEESKPIRKSYDVNDKRPLHQRLRDGY